MTTILLKTTMYCRIIKVSNNFYSLSVWDLEDNMVFWNASKDKNYLIKFAKANYGFNKQEIVGYEEVFDVKEVT